MRITYYVAATLDGFIADENGGVDFLSAVAADGEDYGYGEFIADVDGLVMGRGTYAFVEAHGSWPYDDLAVVMTADPPAEPLADSIRFTDASPAEVVAGLEGEGVRHVWMVGGGRLARSFLDAGLLDRLIVSTVPVVLGGGIPLFAPGPPASLRLVELQEYPTGLIQSVYDVI